MRVISIALMVIGFIGVLVFAGLVLGYYLYSLSPWIQSDITPVQVSADAAKNFDEKMAAFETEIDSAPPGGNQSVSLTITEKEINSKLIELLAEGELPFREILVNFTDGYFLIYLKLDNPGIDAKTGMTGRVEIEDGEPKIVVDDFDLGKLPLPKSANSGVAQALNVLVKLKLADFPIQVSEVKIGSRQLIINGVAKPD